MKFKLNYLLIIITAVVITIPAVLPLTDKEFFHAHDFTHVARLAEMDRAIKDGHFPVRWSKNFGFGYGMPLFNFYGPTPFYLSVIAHTFLISYVGSIKLIMYLSFLLSFLSMYYLSKDYWGKLGGLISATAFIYAPYRAVDAFVRGSLNELYGITFTSLALLAAHKVISTKSTKWMLALAIFLAGIITSHNITALFAFPAILFFSLVIIFTTDKKQIKSSLLKIFTSFLLGILLSAFYAIPAFFEKDQVSLDTITSGYFHYSQHFLYLRQFINSKWGYGGSIYGLEDDMSFEIGKIHLILIILSSLSLILLRKIKRQNFFAIIASIVIILTSIFMATFKTQFLWDKITLLQYIQFPWRFLSLIIIFTSFLSGGVVLLYKKLKLNRLSTSVALIIALILFNYKYFQPDSYLDHAQDLYYSDPQKIQKEMSGILPDYLPKGVSPKLEPAKDKFVLRSGDQTTPLPATIDRTQEFLVEVPLEANSKFIANTFAFPGWQLYINDTKVPFEVDSPLPVLTLDLNQHKLQTDKVYISGIFTETPLRQASNLVSLVSLLIIIYLWQNAGKHNKYS